MVISDKSDKVQEFDMKEGAMGVGSEMWQESRRYVAEGREGV